MLQNPVQCRIYRLGESFKFRKWADCIIGTSALLLDAMSSEISTKSNIGEGQGVCTGRAVTLQDCLCFVLQSQDRGGALAYYDAWAMVFPLEIRGRIDPSATRRFCTP
jgi:hypothetical protein